MGPTTEASDLSEFYAENTRPLTACGVAVALERLSPTDADKLRAAIKAPLDDIQHVAIQRWLDKRNFTLDAATIARHRRAILGQSGGCKCQP